MPDYGHAYDFKMFFHRVERRHEMLRLCDMRVADGCEPIGGSGTRLVAVPLGQHIFVLSICVCCMEALAESFRRNHPRAKVGNVLHPGPLSA